KLEPPLPGNLDQLGGQGEGEGRLAQRGIGGRLHGVKVEAFLRPKRSNGPLGGENVHRMAAGRQPGGELGRDHTAPAQRRKSDHADPHHALSISISVSGRDAGSRGETAPSTARTKARSPKRAA